MPQSNLQALLKMLRKEAQTILICGITRTGKTSLAGTIAALHLASRPRGYSLTLIDAARQLQPLCSVGARNRLLSEVDERGAPVWLPPLDRHWSDRGMLVIDEAHAFVCNPERLALALTMRERGPHGLHLILTSQSPASLAMVVPDALGLVDWIVVGNLPGTEHQKYLARKIGADVSKASKLLRYRFIFWRVTPW